MVVFLLGSEGPSLLRNPPVGWLLPDRVVLVRYRGVLSRARVLWAPDRGTGGLVQVELIDVPAVAFSLRKSDVFALPSPESALGKAISNASVASHFLCSFEPALIGAAAEQRGRLDRFFRGSVRDHR